MRKEMLGIISLSSIALAQSALAQSLPIYEYSTTYQPNLKQIGVTSALHDMVSGTGVGIAILDGYADATHPDLAGKLTTVFAYSGTYSVDGHGTHVAGIAGAARNGFGIVGVAPSAHVYNIPVFDNGGWVASDLGASALNKIKTLNGSGANIRAVNMSYGPTTPGDVFLNGELNLFDNYTDEFVIVRAAGNSGTNAKYEPYSGVASTNLSHLLIVGSVDSNNKISSFSNRPGSACVGPKTRCSASELLRNFWIVAPGRSIVSTYPGGWAYMSGTSMAAPEVAGAVALVASDALQRNVALSPSDIASILKFSATDLGAKGVDSTYGWGLLNVAAALSPVGTTTIATGDTVTDTTTTTTSLRPSLRSQRAAATRGGFADPNLLAGMVVFDDFGRPFEVTDWGSDDAPSSDYLDERTAAFSGIISSRLVAEVNEDGYAIMAWSSGDAAFSTASSVRLVSETLDMRVAVGSPSVFYATTQSMRAHGAEPQSFDSFMFSALGAAGRIFDRAVNTSVKTALSQDWSLSTFALSAFDRVAYLPGTNSPVPFYWNHTSAHMAGGAIERRIGQDWTAGVTYTALSEIGTTAGGDSQGLFGFGDRSLTQTLGFVYSTNLTDNVALGGFYSHAFLRGIGDTPSLFGQARGWSGDQFGVSATISEFLASDGSLRVSAIKPLQITQGKVTAHVPVGREFDGTVLYEDRISVFDGSNVPINLRVEYLALLGPVAAVFSFDASDSDVLTRGDLRYGVLAGLAYTF